MLIKKISIVLLTGLLNRTNRTKSVLLSNLKCMSQPTLNDLNLNEYSQKF